MFFIEYACSILNDGNNEAMLLWRCMSNSRYADTDRIKTCFSSDFRNRTWIEPKPNDGLYRCLYQEGRTRVHCILSVILCSL